MGRLTCGCAAYLLFPEPAPSPVEQLPGRNQAITLVVLDGTWSQARKLLAQNPALAAAPGGLQPPRRPSSSQPPAPKLYL